MVAEEPDYDVANMTPNKYVDFRAINPMPRLQPRSGIILIQTMSQSSKETDALYLLM